MSKLVEALDLDIKQFRELAHHKKPTVNWVLAAVIFHGWSYERAAKAIGITKCGIYEHLQSLYVKKYGRRFSAKNRN